MKSVIQTEKVCFFCGTTNWLEEHHAFGSANRKWSEKYGLKYYLCKRHHMEAHSDPSIRGILQMRAQLEWEKRYGNRNDFMAVFGRNYCGGYSDPPETGNEQIEAITQA